MYTVNELLSIHTIYFDNKNNENIFKKDRKGRDIKTKKADERRFGWYRKNKIKITTSI